MGEGSGSSVSAGIVLEIRLPRALAAAILGGGLALSGYLLQTFFHNPIAGPFILGISSGAKLVVALVMVYLLERAMQASSLLLIAAAFAGAMISMGFVLLMSKVLSHMATLIVSGVMIGYICTAITDFVVTFADDSDIVNLHNWSQGSFSGISWDNVAVMTVVIFLTSACVFLMSKSISAYQLGEAYAQEYGTEYQAVPRASGAALQHSFRLCDGFCRASVLCGNRGAADCEKPVSHLKAASDDSGKLPGRSRLLHVLRPSGADSVRAYGA